MEELKVNKEVNRTEVESLAQESKKVTDEKIEKSLNYDLLSQEEKDKDIAQLLPACSKVEAYKQGLINMEELCDKYGIQSGKTL